MHAIINYRYIFLQHLSQFSRNPDVQAVWMGWGVLVEMPEVFEKVCELADSGGELANYLIELAIYLCELENSERQIKKSGGAPAKI